MNDFGTLLHSSLSCAGTEVISSRLMVFAADTLAHVGIAGILTSLIIFRGWAFWWFWVGVGLILTKEVFFDLPNAGWSGLVVFDSVWDLASWFVGFFAQWVVMARPKTEVSTSGVQA
jgi:hypothetical protein